jgi:hypothetical protein
MHPGRAHSCTTHFDQTNTQRNGAASAATAIATISRPDDRDSPRNTDAFVEVDEVTLQGEIKRTFCYPLGEQSTTLDETVRAGRSRIFRQNSALLNWPFG